MPSLFHKLEFLRFTLIIMRMNWPNSLIQIRMYQPVTLQESKHALLAQKLKFFTPDPHFNQLSYTHWYETNRYHSVLEKMGRIGWFQMK